MISNIQNQKKARELRLSGKSLSEIAHEINISKSTLSNWLKDISLNDRQLSDLKIRNSSRVNRGRLNASIILRSNRVYREKKIYDEAIKEFPSLIKDSFFALGLSLYWAKGSMKGACFQFTSSNQSMILIMLKWVKKYLEIDNDLIRQRKYGECLRIEIIRIDVLRKVIAWQKLLIQYYNRVLDK